MQGFAEWSKRHCTVFGLLDPKQVEMVASWQDLLEARGWGAAQLHAATDALVATPPRFPSEHLGAILDQLRKAGAIEYRRQAEEAPYCTDCQGTGRISLPHINAIVAEEWLPMNAGARAQWYTMAVTCPCARGRFGKFTNARDGHPLMTLEQYEFRNPNWRFQMEWHERELSECAKAQAGPMTTPLDQVLNRLRKPSKEAS